MPTGWKGYLRFSLVSIPIRAYPAINSDADEIHFNQLHDKCHKRIRYVKTCPTHGEVEADEIVLGYQYQKDKYVVVDKSELESLQSNEEKIITIETIVPLDVVDPIYFTERVSYLVPDGAAGQKPFIVFQKAMGDENVAAIGRVVRNGRDNVVMVRARQNLLIMTALSGAGQVNPVEDIAPDHSRITVSVAELKLTKTLLATFHEKKLDLSQFPEHYTARVQELVEAKLAGEEIVAPEASEEPRIINLMDALKQSVASAKSTPAKKSTTKRKPAKSGRAAPHPRARKKSG